MAFDTGKNIKCFTERKRRRKREIMSTDLSTVLLF